jgi:LacI family transcriptional regulator, galactose operon repressor
LRCLRAAFEVTGIIRFVAIRLKGIARDLGLPVVTVSKVLRNHEDVSTETRNRVLRRMKELNYQPNLAARALVTGRSHLIGLVVPDLVHPFFAEVAKVFLRCSERMGMDWSLPLPRRIPIWRNRKWDRCWLSVLTCCSLRPPSGPSRPSAVLRNKKGPYVLVDRRFGGLAANFVGSDDLAVGRMATEHLLHGGCKRVAYIGGAYVSTARDRAEGYRSALSQPVCPFWANTI